MRENAIGILEEEYLASGSELTFAKWVANKSHTDKGFYRWLFPGEGVNDYGHDLNEWQADAEDIFFQDVELRSKLMQA